MKICILSYYFGPKLGIGNYMDNLLSSINKYNKHEIYLVVNQNFINQSNTFSSLRNVKIIENKWLDKGTIISIIYLFFCFHFFLRKNKIDLLVFPTNPIIGFFIPCKILSVIHDINEFEIKNKYGFYTYFRKRIYVRRTLKKSNKIVVISQFVFKQIVNKLNISKEIINKIEIIHNGIELNHTEIKNGNVRGKYFISVGRIDPVSKNLNFLIDFFLKIKEYDIFKDYKLFIIGGINKSSEKSSIEFLKKISTIKDIHYIGYISDEELNSYYNDAQACILMSKFEGFGLPLLEAYSRGCKVIRHIDNQVFDEISGDLDYKVSELDLANPSIAINVKDYLNKQLDFKYHLSSFNWNSVGIKYSNLINKILNY